MDTYSQLKEGMKWMWSLGDYREVAPRLRPHAEALIAVCDIRPGIQVLDVAAGDGNFAVAAAARGAAVTATDLTPRMVEMGRARSAAEGVAIEWLEADAEELPFAADRFDVVASVFGAIFAPRPEHVAAELFRVAKPGGLVAMANYANDGFLARLAELISSYAPKAPVPLASPFLWGEAGVIRSRLERLASSVHVERRTGTFEFDSLEQGMAYWERTNGPQIALRTMLTDDAYQGMRERARQLSRELNRARDGRLLLDFGYALVLARKAEPPGQPTSQGGVS